MFELAADATEDEKAAAEAGARLESGQSTDPFWPSIKAVPRAEPTRAEPTAQPKAKAAAKPWTKEQMAALEAFKAAAAAQ